MDNMDAINNWKVYFEMIGLACHEIPGRSDSIQLTDLAGSPIFVVVQNKKAQDDLHTKARAKSSQIRRPLIVALPIDHPSSMMTLPGDIILPKVRIYAGHAADTFTLSGHQIEPKFLKEIKKEVLQVIESGVTNANTPLCQWVMKLLGANWKYGTPSSLVQMDSMLALISQDIDRLGHVRCRQLSFGRGTGEGTILPIKDYVMRNNTLNLKIPACDLRLCSLETEIDNYSPARIRLYPVYSNYFLTAVGLANQTHAKEIGCDSAVGKSVLGGLPKARRFKANVSAEDAIDDSELYV